MSGLMNSVEFELDKRGSKLTSKEFVLEALERYKQKVKVPAFVAEWIKKHCYMGKHVCLERFMCQYNNVELPTDLYNYYDSDKDGARDKVICAILDGYEVEEEPKWIVKDCEGEFVYDLHLSGVEITAYRSNCTGFDVLLFTEKSKADAVALLVSGEVEKV